MPKKPPGRCIFCGGGGLTDEHILPNKWMRRIFPRTPNDLREWRWRGASGVQEILTMGRTRTREIRKGSIFSLWLHVVCRRCNNGWMHNLEDENGPLLLNLIAGRPGQIPVVGQQSLARWLVKTTMVAEYTTPDDVTFSDADRRNMRDTLAIPNGCQIWIATTTGARWRRTIEHVSSQGIVLISPRRPDSPPIVFGNAQVTFFGLNTFLAIVFSSSAGARAVLETQGEWISGLHQIWPIVHPMLSFPSFALRDEEVDAAHRWFEDALIPPMEPPS